MIDEPAMNEEPRPDPQLQAALADALGRQPVGVDWVAMRRRAHSAAVFRLRAARVAPWWVHVTPWVTRLLPAGALAAAAALALAMATPRATASIADSHDPVAEAIAAPNGPDTISGVAGPVDDEWLWNATAESHAAEER